MGNCECIRTTRQPRTSSFQSKQTAAINKENKLPLKDSGQGVSADNQQIIRVSQLNIIKFPYNCIVVVQASVTQQKRRITGFLISKNLVLTSAHIIPSDQTTLLTVYLYQSQQNTLTEGQSYKECKINQCTSKRDEMYCLIRLSQSVEREEYIKIGFDLKIENIHQFIISGFPMIQQSSRQANVKVSQQYYQKGRQVKIQNNMIYYQMDTSISQEGSPILDNNFMAIGIHLFSTSAALQRQYQTSLFNEKTVSNLFKWKRQLNGDNFKCITNGKYSLQLQSLTDHIIRELTRETQEQNNFIKWKYIALVLNEYSLNQVNAQLKKEILTYVFELMEEDIHVCGERAEEEMFGCQILVQTKGKRWNKIVDKIIVDGKERDKNKQKCQQIDEAIFGVYQKRLQAIKVKSIIPNITPQTLSETSIRNGYFLFHIKQYQKAYQQCQVYCQQTKNSNPQLFKLISSNQKKQINESQIQITKKYAISLFLLALIKKQQGENVKSIEYFRECCLFFDSQLLNIYKYYSQSLFNIGMLDQSQGSYQKAIDELNRCLDYQREVKGKENVDCAETLNCIGEVYNSQGDYFKALEYFKESLAIQDRVNGTKSIECIGCLNNIGAVYDTLENNSQAIVCFQRAIQISDAFNIKDENYALSNWLLGLSLSKEKNYLKAIKCYERVYPIYSKYENKRWIYRRCFKNIADCYKQLGNVANYQEYNSKYENIV